MSGHKELVSNLQPATGDQALVECYKREIKASRDFYDHNNIILREFQGLAFDQLQIAIPRH